jgi:hypothetical protein
MSNLPPLPPIFKDQRKIDSDQLKLLAIFHFVAAGLALLGILFVFLHYTILHSVLDSSQTWRNQRHGPPPPAEFFAVFKWVYFFFGAWFAASGILNVFSGLFIHARKNRTFSLITAGVNCLHVPLGTVLGVFTIMILARDSVEQLYDSKAAEANSL